MTLFNKNRGQEGGIEGDSGLEFEQGEGEGLTWLSQSVQEAASRARSEIGVGVHGPELVRRALGADGVTGKAPSERR